MVTVSSCVVFPDETALITKSHVVVVEYKPELSVAREIESVLRLPPTDCE